MDITACILTKDEASQIGQCLDSVSFCDEILVIDDYSTDKTAQIAKKKGAKVYKRHLDNDFAAQRNFALSKANSKWVLFVDADEVVPPRLAKEIQDIVKQNDVKAVYLRRDDIFLGKRLTHGDIGAFHAIRLARKITGKWKRKVHETWDVKGYTVTLQTPLVHYAHKSLEELVDKINYYSTLHAEAHFEEGRRATLFDIVGKPPLKFVYMYGVRLGFRDGVAGFIMAMMMSWHSFLAWSKLWILQQEN